MKSITFRDLGRMSYDTAWKLQEELLQEVQGYRRNAGNHGPENRAGYILFVEHPHVYTIGKSGKESNLLVSAEKLKEEKIALYHIDRGGDITYHGPGQIVGYPVVDLETLGIGVRKYVEILEESVILTLKSLGLAAGRLTGATGVWMHLDEGRIPEKICAIGVRVSRGVTMHGFAFNVNTDLKYFNYINPCGFTDKGVTSVARETGQPANMEQVKALLLDNLTRLLGVRKATEREASWKKTGV